MILIIRLILAISVLVPLYLRIQNLSIQEQAQREEWEAMFKEINQIRRKYFHKTPSFKPQYNQSWYNVIENPNYCIQSDSLKMVHPDIVLEDMFVWRDCPASLNLQKRITVKKTFAILPYLPAFKVPGIKYSHQLSKQVTYIYTTMATLYNNYRWISQLGCNLQKYSHLPGTNSVAHKSQLINNFMQYIRLFEVKKIKNPECRKNATFIPETYRLNDEKDCKNFFEQFDSKTYGQMYEKYGPQYILKTNEHRGKGITVLFKKEANNLIKEYQRGERCGKIKKKIIAQKYISNPFLYKGHKIEFRIYYTIVSTSPVIAYVYKKALIKRCAHPFSVHSTEKSAHVCNTAIVKSELTDYRDEDEVEDEEFFIDWYLEGIEELLIEQGRVEEGWLNKYLYPKIHRSIIHMIKATYHNYARDSTFGEFYAVDFLLDDNLDVWVLEVNFNPQVLAVTPDRVKRNYKMIEDHFDLLFSYIRSKWKRLYKFMKQYRRRENKNMKLYEDEIISILNDKLEKKYELSQDNLYVKIMDEGIDFPFCYNNLIQKECLVITSKTFTNIRTRPNSAIVYEPKIQQKVKPTALKMIIPGHNVSDDLDTFIPKPSSQKFRTLSSKKTHFASESSVAQTKTNNTEIIKNSPVVQDLAKKIPLNMQKDKDDLYSENVYLKDIINKLTQENYDLKTKLRTVSKDNERMQQVVQTVGGYLQQKFDDQKQDTALMTKLGISENLLTITLKKQIKELKKQSKEQTTEILHLKHQIKYTKIQELETQISSLQAESLRLRTLLEKAERNSSIVQMTHDFNQYEQKFFCQMQIINSLKQENEYHVGQLQLKEEEKFSLMNQIDANQKVVKKQQVTIDDLTQTLKDKMAQMEALQQELDIYKDTNQHLTIKANKLDNNQLRIAQLVKIENQLRKELEQKTRDMEYQDKTNTELKNKLNDKSNFEAKEKQQLQVELSRAKAALEELDSKYKHLLLVNAQSRLRETAPSIAKQPTTINIKNLNNKNQNVTDSINQDKQVQKYKIIKFEDVQTLGLELNYRLRTKKIKLLDAIETYLFDNKNKKAGEVKLKDLQDRLQREPFLLIDEDSALLVARYLTEDNNQEFIIYNDQLTQSITIVRSILIKLVGKIEILSQEEENQKIFEITHIIKKYRNSLRLHFDQISNKYEGLLSREQIRETFEFMDIDLTEEQFDYMFLRLFQYSNNTQLFPYNRIFQVFQEQEKQDVEKVKKIKKREDKPSRANTRIDIFTRRQTQEYQQ